MVNHTKIIFKAFIVNMPFLLKSTALLHHFSDTYVEGSTSRLLVVIKHVASEAISKSEQVHYLITHQREESIKYHLSRPYILH